MKNNISRRIIWLRAVRKYKKLLQTSDTTRKLDILRRRILRMNRAWKLGIATASLMAWLNAPAVGQFPASFELSSIDGTNGFVVDTPVPQNLLSVDAAGDINGDGIDDFILGIPDRTPSGGATGAGEAYVIFGDDTGGFSSGTFNVSSLDGSNGFVISGINTDDKLGRGVSSAGDINGDGIGDLVVSAYRANPSPVFNAGETYVIFGNSTGGFSSGTFELSSINGNNGFIINGSDNNAFSGYSVAELGDVNGDGYTDLLIGAPRVSPPSRSNVGESYVVFGNSSFNSSLDLSGLDGSNGFTIEGGSTNGTQLGTVVSSAGDFNADGVADILLCAPFFGGNNPGVNYVIFGKSTGSFGINGVLSVSTLPSSDGIVIEPDVANNRLGFSASLAGDINGDTVDDLIIGTNAGDFENRSNSGTSYVIFGSSTVGGTINISTLDGSNGFVIGGVSGNDYAGLSVSAAGDVNSDGIDDVLVGAFRSDPGGRTDAGGGYVVFGNSTSNFNGGSFALSAIDGSNGFVIEGVNAGDEAGYSVSNLGDINGDTIGDFIVGAPAATGKSYVIFGQITAPTPEISVATSVSSTLEDSGQALTFVFSSSISPTTDLDVFFSITGDAGAGDYTVLGATPAGNEWAITIPAGQTMATLTVTPSADTDFEPDETVIVTISPRP